MTSPSFRQVRRTVYALKRQYGQAVTLCRTTGNVTNFNTGRMSEVLSTLDVRRAVFLPARNLRDFSYDLSFIAANKNFTLGGYYDRRTRLLLIDRRDISAGWPIDQNMHVMHRGVRWEVKEIHEYDDEECIVLVLDAFRGQPPLNQTQAAAAETLTVTEVPDEDVQ